MTKTLIRPVINSAHKPITNVLSNHLFYYPTPSNLNYN